ncbi:unnamed protein product [Allacma fusca]|uniref:Acireductone dioxygenase n=1 Tax=Allacma fusca TaxID=39272 RepID=A0A8J2L762_9HEXA|nr:unnamed protein product [Allacma fusca]
MVRAWFINEEDLDEDRLERENAKLQFIDPETLTKTTGVVVQAFGTDMDGANKSVDSVKNERGYSYEDCLEIMPDADNLEKLMQKFATEHLHDEEETRFVLDGSTYFDVRSKDDTWIRVEVTKGDLIIVPPGLYHRLTLTKPKLIKLRRLFLVKPSWTSFNRPDADNLDCRRDQDDGDPTSTSRNIYIPSIMEVSKKKNRWHFKLSYFLVN